MSDLVTRDNDLHITVCRETNDVQPRTAAKWWRCYRCHRAFLHARWLARHLIEIHGEAA